MGEGVSLRGDITHLYWCFMLCWRKFWNNAFVQIFLCIFCMCYFLRLFRLWSIRQNKETLTKAKRPKRLSSVYKSRLVKSYHKFKHKSWSNFIFRISTKHQLQSLNQRSASPQNLNFKILTKPSFRILTKIQLRNLDQISAAKYWPKFSFQISPEH